MSIWHRMLIGFLDGLFESTRSDPFGGFGRPYFGDAMMSDDEYRDYIQSHNANNLGGGSFNARTGMWDDGFDGAGIYDENEWRPGPVGIYDDD